LTKITGEKNLKALRISAPWEMVKVHFTINKVPITRLTVDITINETPMLKSGHLLPVSKAAVEYA